MNDRQTNIAGQWLAGMDDTTLRYEEVDDRRACGFGGGTTFTQSEIDSMETGSYEQIPVKVDEVEPWKTQKLS